MKKLTVMLFLLTPFYTHADNNFYASLKSGISDITYKNSTNTYSDKGLQSDVIYSNDDQTKSNFPNVSVAIGYDFSNITPINIRTELEYSYKDKISFRPNMNSIEHRLYLFNDSWIDRVEQDGYVENDIKMQSLMLNTLYDFKNSSKFTPYLGVGLGATYVKSNQRIADYSFEKKKDNDSSFSWSISAGVNYDLNNNVSLDLSYKYLNAGKFKFENYPYDHTDINLTTKTKLISNEYLLGIRYKF